MDADLKWLIGSMVMVTLSLTGFIIGAFRNVSVKVGLLHKKVDDVKEKYVRRDDLDGHLTRIDAILHDMREEMQRNHERLLEAVRKERP